MVHEIFHLYFQGDHVTIANKLHLGEFKPNQDAAAEKKLEDWLKSGCTKQ